MWYDECLEACDVAQGVLYSPLGKFAIGEVLSSGLLVLFKTSNNGPSEGFLGEEMDALS